MTRVASYILATHRRPHLLPHAIAALQRSVVPDGWRMEVVLCHPTDESYSFPGVVHTSAALTDKGSQITRALGVSTGELVLVTDDDDLQSPTRLKAAIWEYESGAAASGFNHLQYVHVPSGRVTHWSGPPRCAVGTMAFARHWLVNAGGWGQVERYADSRLMERLSGVGFDPVHDVRYLPKYVAKQSVFLDHGNNISGDRPQPTQPARHGAFMLTHGGHWRDLADLPQHTRESLEVLCPE